MRRTGKSHHPELERAIQLGRAYSLLRDLQALADPRTGWVYNNRTISYRWLRTRLSVNPRTVRSWMQKLKACGYVEITALRDGMKVRLMQRRQLSLFSEPAAFQGRSTGPAEKCHAARQNSADKRIKTLSTKSIKEKYRAPTPRTIPTTKTGSDQNKTAELKWRQGRIMAARRILGEIEMVRESCVGNGGFTQADRDQLAVRDYKIQLLCSQLDRLGWQEERAG